MASIKSLSARTTGGLGPVLLLLAMTPYAMSVRAQQVRNPLADVQLIHFLAVADPYDRTRFSNYLQTLPQVDGYYVVEGDILLNQEEVFEYLVSRSVGKRPLFDTAELLVNISGGREDFHGRKTSSISYAIDQASFPSAALYELTVQNMNQAANDWAAACTDCHIRFVYMPDDDQSPSTDREDFVVRFHDSKGSYLAHAYFPHENKQRHTLEIDPLYFAPTRGSSDQIGILRHQLGHVLGYRHSRSTQVNGCYFSSNKWVRFSQPYPGNDSVMEYFCTSTDGLNLRISKPDQTGHRQLYGPYANSSGEAGDDWNSGAQLQGVRRELAAIDYAPWIAYPTAPSASDGLQSLYPKDGNYFVVEGDCLFTASELQSYLIAKSSNDTPVSIKSELLVNVYKGKKDFYPNGSRTLTYFVDRPSFRTREEYLKVSDDFREAAHSWEVICKSCKVVFTEVMSIRSGKHLTEPNFIIRYHDAGNAYYASAFFPHTEVIRRFLNVDPSFFNADVDRLAILRHQIGHILGYAHGLHGDSSCVSVLLNVKSLMQLNCDGRPTAGKLRKVDMTSHLTLYGGLSPLDVSFWGSILSLLQQSRSTLRIEFEGGDVEKNCGLVYRKLIAIGILKIISDRVSPFQSIDLTFLTKSEISYDSELAGYLRVVSGQIAKSKKPQTENVLHPNAILEPYTIGRSYDLTLPEDIERNKKDKEKFSNLVLYETEANGIVKRSYRGYGLTVNLTSANQLASVQDALETAHLQDTYIRSPNMYATAQQGRQYFSASTEVDPNIYWTECCKLHHEMPVGEEGNMGLLIGMHPGSQTQQVCGDNCPDVVIIDSPISLHEDLAVSIVDGGKEIPHRDFVKDGKQLIEVSSESVQDTDHGTYMAGIIGCQKNDFGLIGVYPGARIYALRWGDYQEHPVQLQGLLRLRQDRAATQIYLFATSWSYGQLSNESDRFSNKLAEQIANDPTMLWVVAAGQASKSTDPGSDISSTTFPQGPMNLGDKRNVIVVTAVDKMSDPRLLDWANYSTHGLVHIAAPGKDIPGTVSDGRYSVGSGTSPAAAFVAGTAAAMIGSSKYYQQRPAMVKTRLQVTARPILNSKDSPKVASGVLDYEAALLDPTKTWTKFGGEKVYTPIKATRWCTGQLTLLNPEDTNTVIKDGQVETSKILRLFLDVNTTHWIVYSKGTNSGEVVRLGPAVIQDLPLVRVAESTAACPDKICQLNALEDMIIEADMPLSLGCSQ
jgi:hypothetical protein